VGKFNDLAYVGNPLNMVAIPTGLKMTLGSILIRAMKPEPQVAIQKTFHKNGNVFQEVPFVGDVITGTLREYHENGVLAFETPMLNGVRHGTCKQWNDKGELLGTFEMNLGTGVSKRWHPNGKLQFEGHVINEVLNGRVRVWLESGELKQERFYVDNAIVSKTDYSKVCADNPVLPIYEDE
jgi:antitoxin component YwqK of YwqJK toxin-antitoxin module